MKVTKRPWRASHLSENALGEQRRLRLVVAYNGAAFHGFAAQAGDVRTVAGMLGDVIDTVAGERPEIVCAGRTDAGVHAWGQVVHIDVSAHVLHRYDVDRLAQSVNRLLGEEVVVRDIAIVESDFHARFSATERTYRYNVWNAASPMPFRQQDCWWVAEPLDVEAMNAAATSAVGEHDFSTFCRRPKTDEPVSLVRRITDATWRSMAEADGKRLQFTVTGNAFCHQMVRSLVGYFVEVGRGRRRVEDFVSALNARDRSLGAPLAPPRGLVLWRVGYGES